MPGVLVKSLDDMKTYENQFVFAGVSLGVTAWGMNVLKMPPDWNGYPEHDHKDDGQEEVYVVLAGSATLEIGDDHWNLLPGVFVRVGPGEMRKIRPGASGATILAIGGTPGSAYAYPDWLLKAAGRASAEG